MCWTPIPLRLCLWVKWLCLLGELCCVFPVKMQSCSWGRVSLLFEEYGCVPWGIFFLGTNVLIVVLTKEIVVLHGEYGCVFLKEMQLYSWESVCVPQRTWFVFPKEMLFLEINFCSTRVSFLWGNGCVLWIVCSLKKCNYVLKRILVFPKEYVCVPQGNAFSWDKLEFSWGCFFWGNGCVPS